MLVEPQALLRAVKRRWMIVAVCAVAGLGLAGWFSVTRTPMYRATSSLFFSVSGGDSTTNLLQGSTFSQNAVRSYALLATMPAVLEPVIEDLHLDTAPRILSRSISTQIPPDSVVMNITAVADDADDAASLANAVARELQVLVGKLSAKGDQGARSLSVVATSVAKASPPVYPFTPNTRRNLVLGGLAGLLIGLAIAVLRESLDTRVRSEEDVHEVTDTAVLGQIPDDSTASKVPVLTHGDHGMRAESIRRLSGNLDYVSYSGKIRSLLVTSSLPNEGKTLVAVNLAVMMSESQKVLLVDADMRNPSVAPRLGLEGSVGLSTVLSGRASLGDAIQSWRRGQIDILCAGQIPPNPSALLGSQKMALLLAELVETYDVIVIDSPPVMPVSDSTLLGKNVDGAVIVTNARRTTKGQLSDCLGNLSRSGTRVLGIVLNRVQTEYDTYYYGGSRTASPAMNPRAGMDGGR